MVRSLTEHWPEYLIEGALLGVFMVVACAAVAVVEHPDSRVRTRIRSAFVRRAVIGLLMGITAVALIYSPMGQRSGAHMNPAFTLAFWALGRVEAWDAVFYVAAQFLGGWLGVVLTAAAVGPRIGHASVAYAVTVPGPRGRLAAWLGEVFIAAMLMAVVLFMVNRMHLARFTGLAAGTLVAAFIVFEAPLSGMSLNPARTLASALPSRVFRGLWVYLTAPPIGMLAGGAIYLAAFGDEQVYCARLSEHGQWQCIFRCRHELLRDASLKDATPAQASGIESQGAANALRRGR